MYYTVRNALKQCCLILLLVYLPTTTALEIDCNNPPQLVDPQTCCTDGGRNEVSEKCSAKFGVTGAGQQAPNIDTATCLAQCVMTESKYLIGQEISIPAIQADLQRRFPLDPQYVNAMTRAFQKCIPIAQRRLEELRRTPQGEAVLRGKCSPLSGIVLGCTYTEYFQTCPSGHWTPSEQCNIAKQFLQKCAVF